MPKQSAKIIASHLTLYDGSDDHMECAILRPTPQETHINLAKFNHARLQPGLIDNHWATKLKDDMVLLLVEGQFVEQQRALVQQYLTALPEQADDFMLWFEALKLNGPGQRDALFPWLATQATLDEMRWFLTQEAAGEAGFDDLVAMTQVKLPDRSKLEMARNYWDEMGRGNQSGMHGPMLSAVIEDLKLTPSIENTVWESLALANLMLALATNRRYAYQSVGALGVIEMTAPTRVGLVNDGMKRLQLPFESRRYFQLHATLDINHSAAWNEEVIYPLVKDNPQLARPIAEGALMRLMCGQRCFERYKGHFKLPQQHASNA